MKLYQSRWETWTMAALTAAALTWAGQLSAADRNQNENQKTDTAFLQEAAQGNLAEVKLGQLAGEKAQNSQVKQLGQRLQQHHAKANQQLEQIAQKMGTALPKEVDRQHQQTIEKLEDASGAEFDRVFTETVLQEHQKDIKKYEQAAASLENQALKSYAQQTLPVLREHLKMAQTAGRAIGLPDATISGTGQQADEDAVGGAAGRPQQGTERGANQPGAQPEQRQQQQQQRQLTPAPQP